MSKWALIILAVAGITLAAFLVVRKSEPRVLWVKSVAADWPSPPVIGSDGAIYFGDMETNLCAVARDGSFRWKTRLVTNSPPLRPFLTGAAIDSNRLIYATVRSGALIAVGLEGKVRWSLDLGIESTATAFAPDGTLYIGSRSNRLYAINSDGSVRWAFKTTGQKTGSPEVGPDGTIYFACSSTNLYALNPDGTLKWMRANGAQFFSEPVLGPDGTIYIESWPDFHAIRPDGTIKWTLTKTEAYSSVLDSSGRLFLSANDGVIAVEAATGEMIWKHKIDVAPLCGMALASDGTVYFSGHSSVCAINRDGKFKWKFHRDPFARTGFWALSARFGEWVRAFGKGRAYTYPCSFTLTEDGRLYAIMADSKLYALQVSCGLATNAPWPRFKHDVRHSGGASGMTK